MLPQTIGEADQCAFSEFKSAVTAATVAAAVASGLKF